MNTIYNEETTRVVNALLAKMSIDEKVGQLAQISGANFLPGVDPEEIIRKGGAGSVLWLNDTRRFNELQKIAVEESPSGIPLLFALDVIHGVPDHFPCTAGDGFLLGPGSGRTSPGGCRQRSAGGGFALDLRPDAGHRQGCPVGAGC